MNCQFLLWPLKTYLYLYSTDTVLSSANLARSNKRASSKNPPLCAETETIGRKFGMRFAEELNRSYREERRFVQVVMRNQSFAKAMKGHS